MTKINGQHMIETIETPDVETHAKWSTIQRQIDRGYRRFCERRGLTTTTDMRSQVTAGLRDGVARKGRGE